MNKTFSAENFEKGKGYDTSDSLAALLKKGNAVNSRTSGH